MQPELNEEERKSFEIYHNFLLRELPQFYFGILIMLAQSFAKGNGILLQEKLAILSKEMDAINKGEGLS